MHTRRCSTCRQAKTIRGVWYIFPPADRAPDFVCESCMRRTTASVA